jgi:hypothetical protein
MGYASRCSRLPEDRTADSNRFRVSQSGAQITIFFCSELRHAPVEQGTITFDPKADRWVSAHANACIQRQAECALRSWQAQRPPVAAPDFAMESQNALETQNA